MSGSRKSPARPHPHDALQGVLVEEPALLGGLLEPEYEPGTGHPVGVELICWNCLKKLLLVLCHEAGLHHMVQAWEPLFHSGGDGAKHQDHGQVHPPHERASEHSGLIIETLNVASDGMEELVRPWDGEELLPPT